MKVISRHINTAAAILLERNNVPPLLARLYASRGINDVTQINQKLSLLLRPDSLLNCDKAGKILANAITKKEKIIVIADYDADGATACALIVDFLRTVGATVNYMVPDRRLDGYGLTTDLVNLTALNKPDWLITVDNGIASVEGVKRANELGIKTIITDHHLPGELLPNAEVIVNPNQEKCRFTSKNLCGVGVIFYVATTIKKHLLKLDWFDNHLEPNMTQYLDLVSLGTIADVVSLDHNNRILVERGLHQIRSKKCRVGIQALAEVAGKSLENLTSQDLGFSIAPRLNAAGRMENMGAGIECLLANTYEDAYSLAENLNCLNIKRKNKETEMTQSVATAVNDAVKSEFVGHTYFDESWHEGIVGILASRIKEKVNRPVFVFAPSVNPLEIKGSGRSIPHFHLRDALDTISKIEPTLIIKFGGHAMAAGLTIKKKNIVLFRKIFNSIAKKILNQDQLAKLVLTDGPLNSEINITQVEEIQNKVWGQDFEIPIFTDTFRVIKQELIANAHKKLQLIATHNLRQFEAICFREKGILPAKIEAIYQLNVNNFKGRKTIQLVINHWHPCD